MSFPYNWGLPLGSWLGRMLTQGFRTNLTNTVDPDGSESGRYNHDNPYGGTVTNNYYYGTGNDGSTGDTNGDNANTQSSGSNNGTNDMLGGIAGIIGPMIMMVLMMKMFKSDDDDDDDDDE